MTVGDITALMQTALGVSLPTFGWVSLGLLLRGLGLLSERWIAGISRLAFNAGLPVMLFAAAVQVDYRQLGQALYVAVGATATLLVFALSWLCCRWRGWPWAWQGIYVQAAFRSNLAIVGVALCIAAYGERGAVLAALPIALLTLLYNVLAVWVLDTTLGSKTSLGTIALGIGRNPLIIGIAAGVMISLSGVPVPAVSGDIGALLSRFFLPLMLVCIGGSLRIGKLRSASPIVWEATAWRLVLAPALGVGLALLAGVRGDTLGVLFLLLSAPVATASFVMVVAARGDGELAANLVVLTTLCSLVTVTLGFFLLVLLGVAGQPL